MTDDTETTAVAEAREAAHRHWQETPSIQSLNSWSSFSEGAKYGARFIAAAIRAERESPLPTCICGHAFDAHDGHTISVGQWPQTHCSQFHPEPCMAYYPAACE